MGRLKEEGWRELELLEGICGEEAERIVASESERAAVSESETGRGEADSERELTPEVLAESALWEAGATLKTLCPFKCSGTGLSMSDDSEDPLLVGVLGCTVSRKTGELEDREGV